MERLWIEHLLKQRKKKKSELATALDLPPSRISELLKGRRNIKSQEIQKLSKFLDVDIDTVLEHINGEKSPRINTYAATTELIVVIGEHRVEQEKFQYWPDERYYSVSLPIHSKYTGIRKFGIECQNTTGTTLLICVLNPSSLNKNKQKTIQITNAISSRPAPYENSTHDLHLDQKSQTTAYIIADYRQF
jgi:transcriptional regulator with XRE-family HTH domain